MAKKTAIIIGAGPAGLTAAYELLEKSDIQPIIYEMTEDIGGLCKTVSYKGNRIDIGGHRFFSKSDRVMSWWLNIMPLQGTQGDFDTQERIHYQKQSRLIQLTQDGPDPQKTSLVMLIRRRLSRIFYLRKFFDYPISLNFNTLRNLGLWRIIKIGTGYIQSRLFPIKPEKSLEDFFINRFGKELYLTFFKDYTQKVWGIECNKIDPEWGAQRVKGLSVTKAILHAIKKIFSNPGSIQQKNIETSLIERFMYPKLGPGQLWEEVARQIQERGGEIHKNYQAIALETQGKKVLSVTLENKKNGNTITQQADYVFSTMPVKDLVKALGKAMHPETHRIAQGLVYRDFITVGLLLKELKIKNKASASTRNNLIPDNWIYIQEKDVKIGRLQIFNNWSPYMVQNPDTVWIGLEYFCNEGDDLWNQSNEEFVQFAIKELCKIDIIEEDKVIDATIIRMPKTYPAYFGTYSEFPSIRKNLDSFHNLFLIGRNGMHRYNNQDHSMLTAMVAVENILQNIEDKENIWQVNTEQEYHEEKKSPL
ncbi:MAG: NAD(P)/FAD-dependent oxidoreductase [Candidatus Brocadiae bacterium]|nr:NAD(P)/FAD-dependent oxidoreductase [Candidatus Brocadiia bacterium]